MWFCGQISKSEGSLRTLPKNLWFREIYFFLIFFKLPPLLGSEVLPRTDLAAKCIVMQNLTGALPVHASLAPRWTWPARWLGYVSGHCSKVLPRPSIFDLPRCTVTHEVVARLASPREVTVLVARASAAT